MRIAESELIINPDGTVFHLHIKPEQLADFVFLVGDQDRVNMFKPYLSSIEAEGQSREFHWITGMYNGKRITALSTGIGTDNIDIVMNELDALANIDFTTREPKAEHRTLTILRIGTCGAIQPDIPLGSFIFSEYSIGTDGLLNWYANREEITNVEMEKAFAEHIHKTPYIAMPYFAKASDKVKACFEGEAVIGMTIAAPGFYGPQGRVLRMQLALPNMVEDFESFRYEGKRITNFEMEGSAIAGIAGHLGHNAGTICCVVANRYLKDANTQYKPRVEQLVKLALERLTTIEA